MCKWACLQGCKLASASVFVRMSNPEKCNFQKFRDGGMVVLGKEGGYFVKSKIRGQPVNCKVHGGHHHNSSEAQCHISRGSRDNCKKPTLVWLGLY